MTVTTRDETPRTPLEAAMPPGLTQTRLAELAGLPREQVNGYVSGRLGRVPTNAARFAAVLDTLGVRVTASSLITALRRNEIADRLEAIDQRLAALEHTLAKLLRAVG